MPIIFLRDIYKNRLSIENADNDKTENAEDEQSNLLRLDYTNTQYK